MRVRIPTTGAFAQVGDLIWITQPIILSADVSTAKAGAAFEPIPGAAVKVPAGVVREGGAARLGASIVCSNDKPGGLILFQFRIDGAELIGRETGIRNAGAVALELFTPLDGPQPSGPVLVELCWRSTVGLGAIRAALPTDGEGLSFSAALWDTIANPPIPV